MKTFHVSILYSTPDGPVVETKTIQCFTPLQLHCKVALEVGHTYEDLGWVFIAAQLTEIKDAIDVKGVCDLALAN